MPEFYDYVDRAAKIKVRALDRDGKAFELEAEGLLAVCIQHEIDHLEGKLFVDYLSELKRERLKKKAAKKAKRAATDDCRARAEIRYRSSERAARHASGVEPRVEAMAARIAFAGTPEFAVPALNALVASGAQVPFVLTQPDRPAGRGRGSPPSPVKVAAQTLGLRVAQPRDVCARRRARQRSAPQPDLLIVIAYGLLLPQRLLAWPRLGCVNLHASLLPRWRGAAPIQRAILARDETTGISVMQMEPGSTRAPSISRRDTPIGARETAGVLHDRLAELAARTLAAALPDLLAAQLAAQPQQGALATNAPKIAKADARLDWRRSAVELERKSAHSIPGPLPKRTSSDGRRLRDVGGGRSSLRRLRRPPGTVVAAGRDGIDVAAPVGVLRLAAAFSRRPAA